MGLIQVDRQSDVFKFMIDYIQSDWKWEMLEEEWLDAKVR
jgi:hypothetical protein